MGLGCSDLSSRENLSVVGLQPPAAIPWPRPHSPPAAPSQWLSMVGYSGWPFLPSRGLLPWSVSALGHPISLAKTSSELYLASFYPILLPSIFPFTSVTLHLSLSLPLPPPAPSPYILYRLSCVSNAIQEACFSEHLS